MIRLDRFGGTIPKLNPEKLPEEAAQVAHNCDVTSGALAPLNLREPFVQMHDPVTLKLLANVPEADVVQIAKPTAPSLERTDKICQPLQWLQIWAYDYVSTLNSEGLMVTTVTRAQRVPLFRVVYTEVGLHIIAALNPVFYMFPRGGPYYLRGPRYQFVFLRDIDAKNGGPDQSVAYPWTPTVADRMFPTQQIPLIDSNTNVYGFFQVTDVQGPRYDKDILVEDFDFIWDNLPSQFFSYVTFTINMNYAIPRRRHFFYVQSAVNAADQEGPPSELSPRITVKPGEEITLNTPQTEGTSKNRLYRSTTGGDDFLLLEEVTTSTFKDQSPQLKAEDILPFGNFPSEVDAETFLEGSQMHPAQMGVAYHDKTVYFTDPYRLHSWPDENTVPMKDAVKAIAMSGNSVIVFAGDTVFAITGSNPKFMSKYTLSGSTPLLNKLSLCQIGQTVFFATNDGLAGATARGVTIVTSGHFTREQWQFLSPEKMVAKTADNTILLETTSSFGRLLASGVYALGTPFTANSTIKLRLDLDEELSAVTTYSALTGAQLQWRSKRYWFDQETLFHYVRVTADAYPVTLKLLADREEVISMAIDDSRPKKLLNLSHAHEWEIDISGSNLVRMVDVFDRVVTTISDTATLTPENTPLWESSFFKFLDRGVFCAGILSAQTTDPILIDFFADNAITKVHTAEVVNGRVFTFPRTLLKATLWEVSIVADVHIDELILMRRVTESVRDVIHEVNGGGIAPWLTKRYEYTDRAEPKGLIVHATAAVTINLYYDGAETPTESIDVVDGDEIRLDNGVAGAIEFDFGGRDTVVTEVILTAVGVARPIGTGAVQLTNESSLRRMLFQFPDRGTLAAASVGAKSYSDPSQMVMELYKDGVSVHTVDIENGNLFLFPRDIGDGSRWEVDIQKGAQIDSVILLPRRPVDVTDGLIREVNPDTIPRWVYSRYKFPEDTYLTSVLVDAEAPVSMSIYLDGAEEPTQEIPILPGVEYWLQDLASCRSVEFEFQTEDYKVREVSVFTRQVTQIGNEGIDLPGRLNWRMLAFKFVNPETFACGVVGLDKYTDVALHLWADGEIAFSESVAGPKVFRLPRDMVRGVRWDLDVETADKVENVVLIPRQPFPAGDSIRSLNDTRIPEWLYRRYEFLNSKSIQSVIVHATGYPVTMNIYCDGATGASQNLSIEDAGEVRLEIVGVCNSVEFDFDVDDDKVRDVTLFAHEERLIGPSGVTLPNPPSARGLRFRFPEGGVFAVAMVGTSDYDDVALTLYADGASVYSAAVADGKAIVLPRTLEKAGAWEADIATKAEVTSLVLLPRATVRLEGDTLRETASNAGIAPWLARRYEFLDRVDIRSVAVHATKAVTMNLYVDGAESPTESIDIKNGDEIRVPDLGLASSIEFDFDGDDGEVSEILIYGKKSQSIGEGGVDLSGAPSWRGNLFKFTGLGSFALVSVASSSYSKVILTLYADGKRVFRKRIANGKLLQIPRTVAEGSEWEVDIETDAKISGVVLIPWRREAVEGKGLRVTAQDAGVAPWLFTRYELAGEAKLRSGIVKSDRYSIPMRLYFDRSTTANTHRAWNEYEFEFPSFSPFTTVSFDFSGRDNEVNEVYLFPEETESLQGSGFVFRSAGGLTSWRNKVLRFPDVGSFSVVRVVATDYTNLNLTLSVAGVEKHSVAISDSGDVKLPTTLPNARDWELSIAAKADVHEVVLISRQVYAVDGGLVTVRQQEDPFTWLDRRVIAQRPVAFSCARVVADSYPVTLRLFSRGKLKHERTIRDERAVRIPKLRPEREWIFDVVAGATVAVHEVSLATSMSRLR